MNPDIRHVNGHYEAYDRNGKFICSGDSKTEVENELKEMHANED
jgi:hypothetical protein